MIAPTFTLTGNDNRIQLHLQQFTPRLQKNLTTTVTKLTNELATKVRAAEPVRTGFLRSRTRQFVDVRSDMVRGRVRIIPTGRAQRIGAAFGALEYGAKPQSVSVQSYRRGGVMVAAYHRRFHIREHRFLRGPSIAMRTRVIAELEATVARTAEEINRS